MQLVAKYFIAILFVIPCSKVYTQFVVNTESIDSINEVKEIDPIEANFLFSYYEQDGTKSPVTGGIGDEGLQDRVGNISLNIPINQKLKFTFLGGIDVYSSASTDNINNEYGLYTETSASSSDTRVYGNLGVQIKNDKKRIAYGFGGGWSHEYDVRSLNGSAFISKLSKNRNTLFYLKGNLYNDKWKLFFPTELRWKYNKNKVKKEEGEDEEDDDGGGNDVRNSYNVLFNLSQDISPKLKASISIEATYQDGMLSTPFHRVYFLDSNQHDIENLPRHRLKFPIGLHVNYYINKYAVVRLFYRYYFDDFNVKGHTASIELPIKPVQSFAISPYYRFHTQTASKYFQPFSFHSISDRYYTSDFDLADIQSNRVGLELRFSPFIKSKNESNKKQLVFKKIAIRGSKYFRLRQNELILKSYIIALQLSFRIE